MSNSDTHALEKELQESAAAGQLVSAVAKLTATCFDLCIDKPRDKLDYKSETCVTNCAERFIDVTTLVTQRFQQLIQKQMGQY